MSLLPAAALVASMLLLAGCSRGEKEQEPIVTVEVAAVQKFSIQRKVQTEAVLYPAVETPLAPKISAPVRKFYVNRGSPVHAGELLAELENRDLQASLLESKGAYEAAQANYDTFIHASLPQLVERTRLDVKAARQSLQAAQRIYQSRQFLFAQGAVPRRDLEQAKVALTQAQNQYQLGVAQLKALRSGGREQQLKAAAGQLASAQGRYQAAQAQLSYSEIRSAINGVVSDRLLNPGDTATAGQPVITVMDISTVVARAHISQQQASWLKLGDAAAILAPAMQDGLPGKVTMISPALDPNSTTVEVWVKAANPDDKLRAGGTVQETIVAETVPDALVVPAAAVQTAPDGTTSVMVVGADGRAHQRSVTAGIRDGDVVQITKGLEAGERVVTQGAYGLPDHTRIKIEAGQPSGAASAH